MTRLAEPVLVWALALAAADHTDARRWRLLLSQDEQAKADRFVFAADRLAYLAAHALTRRMLAEMLGCPPDMLHFAGGPLDKPRAWIGDRPAGIQFNLSHTRGMVALAVSAAVDPGIDVEALHRPADLSLAESVFAPWERQWLMALPPAKRSSGFFRLWTLKEAYVKATGLGLSEKLDRFGFAPDTLSIQFAPEIADDPAAWRFHQQAVDGFVLAVGWRGPKDRAMKLTRLAPWEV